MKTPTEQRAIVKIFVGFELTKAVNRELNKSSDWKKMFIAREPAEKNLARIPYKGKEYVGLYAKHAMLSTQDLYTQAGQIKQFLQECAFKGEDIPILIFSQVFVS